MTRDPHPHSLRSFIDRAHASGDLSTKSCMDISAHICRALNKLHREKRVHGAVCPENILLGEKEASFVDTVFPFAQDYHSPERLRGGPPSFDDDLYALGASFFEIFTGQRKVPAYALANQPLHAQIRFDPTTLCDPQRIQLFYDALDHDPAQRPLLAAMATMPTDFEYVEHCSYLVPDQRFEAGPYPPKTSDWIPDRFAVHVLSAPSKPEIEGNVLPLNKLNMTIGSDPNRDLCIPEETIFPHHARVEWPPSAAADIPRRCRVTVEPEVYAGFEPDDRGPASFDWHFGQTIVLGACLLRLVSFTSGSPEHARAQRYLETHTLTFCRLPHKPLRAEAFAHRIRRDKRFARWAALPWCAIRGRAHCTKDRPPTLRAYVDTQAIQAMCPVFLSLMECISSFPPVIGHTGPLELTATHVGVNKADLEVQVQEAIKRGPKIQLPSGYRFDMEVLP